MEALFELGHPLFDEVRRAQDGDPLDVAPIEKLASDESRLDGLANTDIVRNQQTHWIQLERHEKRHKLICARLNGDLTEAAKGPRTSAKREKHRVAEQQCAIMTSLLIRARSRERCISHGLGLEVEMDEGQVILGA
jgi:hypothetical protein